MAALQNVPITVMVLAYNEEQNLPRMLSSVAGWAGEIVVVDSGSTDRTLAIAERHGARIFHHNFTTHTRQWQWALENTAPRYEWILGLDADQRITPELRAEIGEFFCHDLQPRLPSANTEPTNGFYIKRRQIFRGKWIRHGGYYPKYLLKLFRRDSVKLDHDDLVDHHFYVRGATTKLHHDIIEENDKENDITFWIEKHNHYATLLARQELQRRGGCKSASISANPLGNPDERAVWRKQVWTKLPLYVRAWGYFFYRYGLLLGFLDGKQGFIFHFLQGFWFRLVIDIKIDEMSRAISKTTGQA